MNDDNTWQPLDPGSLVQYEKEDTLENGDRAPDYDLFKQLYQEDPETGGDDRFFPLYQAEETGDSQDKDQTFSPLYSDLDGAEKNRGRDSPLPDSKQKKEKAASPPRKGGTVDDEKKKAPEKAPEKDRGYDIGFREGYDRGKKEGVEQGEKKAFDKSRQQAVEEAKKAGEQEGYDRGFEKGEKEAKAQGDARALEVLASLEDILDKTENSWGEFVQQFEEQIISLVCRIAEKVVLARVDVDSTLVKESIFHALEKLPEPREIVLNVSSDDYEYIEMIKEEFFEKIETLSTVSVVSNPGINRSGCRIETSKADVETDIETRLEAVFDSVKGTSKK
ncbi:MAG TPA: FliH/SctL family protein [Desulfobacteraceae bacterium]|nr:FliH/SctL family protein [Desulfobacteraceae bacterium]